MNHVYFIRNTDRKAYRSNLSLVNCRLSRSLSVSNPITCVLNAAISLP